MNKLSHYKDNLFASHATMESALEYVSMVANTFTTENSLAVITAARVVLNTAIELHKAELAKANAPLLELIDARVSDRIKSALDNIHYAIETNMRTVDEKIQSAIDDIDVEGQIENAIDNVDFETKVQDYMESNPVDVQDLLGGACVSITFG
jgi:hypothetical protein